MLAYVFWHRPAARVVPEAYEQHLQRLHHSLARRPPGGFRGSATLRAPEIPWLGQGGAGYEDWYLTDDWTAIGVLEAAAVAQGHRSAHDAAARTMGEGTGSIFHRREGKGAPAQARLATWVQPTAGPTTAERADLLADGADPAKTALWQRALALGPSPELCLLAQAPAPAAPGVSRSRLPNGWRARDYEREPLAATRTP
jgi:hypothetical protein